MTLIPNGKIQFPPTAPEYTTVELITYIDDSTREIVVVDEPTNTELFRIGGSFGAKAIFTPNAQKSDLDKKPYIDYVIGQRVVITDYNVSTFGCMMEKATDTGKDFTDWIIISTDKAASTGKIGTNPI